MPPTYRILTCLIGLTGDASLLLSEGMFMTFLLTVPFMLWGYYRGVKGYPSAHRFVVGGLSLITLLYFFLDVTTLSRDVIVSVGHLTMIFHAIKSFDIKDPWDPLQVFFMALIQLLLASELTRSMVFAVVFVFFIIGMVIAMFYSHIIKEGGRRIRPFVRPITSLTVIIMLLVVVLFLALPRFRGSLWGKSLSKGIKSGFSEKVRLGTLEEIKLDPTVVMRVSVQPRQGFRPYWRGMTFDIYLDNAWLNVIAEKLSVPGERGRFNLDNPPSERHFRQEIILEPLDTEVIFSLRGVYRLDVDAKRLLIDTTGTLFVPEKRAKRLRYIAYSSNKPLLTDDLNGVYLQVPDDLGWLKGFTEEIVRGLKTPLEKAETIQRYLRENYRYSLKVKPPSPGESPIKDFLITTREGYCEYYATAMVLMLRSIGIPARVVSGYVGGEYNRYGDYYIIRQKNAHTWVEAAIDGLWQRFDPTPPEPPVERTVIALYLDFLKLKWDRYVIGFSRYDQKRLLRFLSTPVRKRKDIDQTTLPQRYIFPIFAASVIFALLILGYNLYRRRRALRRESIYYLKIRRLLEKRLDIDRNLTAEETAKAVIASNIEVRTECAEFLKLYNLLRFGKEHSENDIIRFRLLYKRIKERI